MQRAADTFQTTTNQASKLSSINESPAVPSSSLSPLTTIDMSGSVTKQPSAHHYECCSNKKSTMKSFKHQPTHAEGKNKVGLFRRRRRNQASKISSSCDSWSANGESRRDSGQRSNASSSSASSLSLMGLRERLHRWQILGRNHGTVSTQASKSNVHNAYSICTAGTSASTLPSTADSGGSSLFSLGRLSSRWSVTPPHPAMDISSATTSSRIATVKEEVEPEEETPSFCPQENGTTKTEAKETPACPTTRFFATKVDDSIVQVEELELVLDGSGQMGIYSGLLDMETKRPHGRGKMKYFPAIEEKEENEGEAFSTKDEEMQREKSQEMEQSGMGPALIYDGQWQNGDWCGFGTLMDLVNGHTYEGGFFDNYKHGLGVLQYADGRVYDGIFAFGKLEGKGHLEYPDGTTYWGHWTSDGIEHGRGKKVFADGRVYDGEFDNGILHGHGRMTFADGSWYLGEWIDGEQNGLGILVLPDGNLQFEGTFIHGSPIEGSSCPNHSKKSDGDFLRYRSSVAKHGTLVGNIPKHVFMRGEDKLKWAK